MASWRALDLAVSSTDDCLESAMRWPREGQEKLRPSPEQEAAGDISCCHSALPRDAFTPETVPFVGLSPRSQLSSAHHTQWLLCLALIGADRGENIRPAKREQCLPSWEAPSLARRGDVPLMMLLPTARALPALFQGQRENFGHRLPIADSILASCPLAGCILSRELGIQTVTPWGIFFPKPPTCCGSDYGVWHGKPRAPGSPSPGKSSTLDR